jgi:hypothetical protein
MSMAHSQVNGIMVPNIGGERGAYVALGGTNKGNFIIDGFPKLALIQCSEN